MSVTFSYNKAKDSWEYENCSIPRSFIQSHTEEEIQKLIEEKIKVIFPLDIIGLMKNNEV